MARRRADLAYDDAEPAAPLWMVSFADMVTLLMAFFIMLVAVSNVELDKFREAISYFQGGTGVMAGNGLDGEGAPVPGSAQAAVEEAQRQEDLLRALQAAGLDGAVTASITARGLQLTVADSVVFAPGEARLAGRSETVLRLVARAVSGGATGVIVEGHTDSTPIKNPQYPSNWELSAARAASVVRFLLAQPGALEATRYQASGYGEFRPRAANTTADGRGRNRRVEILITTDPWPENPLPPLPLPPTP